MENNLQILGNLCRHFNLNLFMNVMKIKHQLLLLLAFETDTKV